MGIAHRESLHESTPAMTALSTGRGFPGQVVVGGWWLVAGGWIFALLVTEEEL